MTLVIISIIALVYVSTIIIAVKNDDFGDNFNDFGDNFNDRDNDYNN